MGADGGKTGAVRIDSLAFGGAGIGRLDGKVVFVPYTLPGETVRFRVLVEKKSYIEARLLEVFDPSPVRQEPGCPHFGRCGGCHYQHIPYPLQTEFKLQQVEGLFKSRGLLPGPGPHNGSCIQVIQEDDLAWGWRARARLHLHASWPEARLAVGFKERGGDSIIPLQSCPVLTRAAQDCLVRLSSPEVRGMILDFLYRHVASQRRGRRRRPARQIEAEVSIATGLATGVRGGLAEQAIFLQPSPARQARRPGAQRGQSEAHGLWIEGDHNTTITFASGPLAPKGLRTHPLAFYQANVYLNPRLCELVVASVASGSRMRVLELFSGSGNFTIPLALQGLSVTAVESDSKAVAACRRNAEENGVAGRVEMICSPVQEALCRQEAERFEVVVLDPPRSGAKEACRHLAAWSPRKIVYVSCDPMTLARDVAILASGGYRLRRLVLVDMFPQTAHMELVATLER